MSVVCCSSTSLKRRARVELVHELEEEDEDEDDVVGDDMSDDEVLLLLLSTFVMRLLAVAASWPLKVVRN